MSQGWGLHRAGLRSERMAFHARSTALLALMTLVAVLVPPQDGCLGTDDPEKCPESQRFGPLVPPSCVTWHQAAVG